ncbi:FMN-dependent NADH-azoreductase [Sphingopyxis sp.]|jgi:FMN-dependent NADH-azoreductase|uniref:FMN-dependent NADH-azoreductase n=1 Tax=Sphingopyxis sp. TaxID=1908224 RepID=UPI002D796A5C|nr:NAD(P)H-dependent oxidoreductase [Sphingopyxis sp.]HET6526656.1 NAD(P)H-dependent oxidoreductase [Sphingopyxis sp.]
MSHILRIDASARQSGSTTRRLADQLEARLVEQHYGATVTRRDLGLTPPAFLTEHWVGANFTDEAERSDEQKALLAGSEELIAEIEAADTIVITAPIYNFAIPATLKAWIDQVTRARRTFRYTEAGPEGLLKGKRAYIVFASGGVPLGSQVDFASGYLRHILGFIGITDVHVIAADGHQTDGEAIARAATAIDGLKQAA